MSENFIHKTLTLYVHIIYKIRKTQINKIMASSDRSIASEVTT